MRKFILILLFSSILFCSCQKEKVEFDVPKTQFLSTYKSGSIEVFLQSSHVCSLEIPQDATWIKCNNAFAGGYSEIRSFVLEHDANTAFERRSARLKVKLEFGKEVKEQEIEIVQMGKGEDLPPVFYSFAFNSESNKEVLNQNITLAIGEGNDTISGTVPYLYLTNLTATFDANGEVYVGDVKQQSGVTANNFTKPVEYRVVNANGTEKKYTVSVKIFTGLPILFIDTDDIPINSKDIYRTATFSFYGNNLFEDLELNGQIKGRGNSTWGHPKNPYRIKLDSKAEILGFPAAKNWVLLANYFDYTGLHNEVAFDLSRRTSLEYTPRSAFLDVFINDVYNGTYQFTEQMEIGDYRVQANGGYLLEFDHPTRLEPGDISFGVSHVDEQVICIKEPDLVLDSEEYNWVKNYVNSMESALFSDNFKDPVLGYKSMIDVESFVGWYLVNEITKNQDSNFYSSAYMNITKGGRLKMGPVWDFDKSLGDNEYGKEPEGLYTGSVRWYKRMLEDPAAFVAVVKTRYNEVFYAHKSDIMAKIDANAKNICLSMMENDKAWRFLTIIDNNTYKNRIKNLKTWLGTRMDWLKTEFDNM